MRGDYIPAVPFAPCSIKYQTLYTLKLNFGGGIIYSIVVVSLYSRSRLELVKRVDTEPVKPESAISRVGKQASVCVTGIYRKKMKEKVIGG